MSDFKFDYNISETFDREAFDATCKKLDSHIPPLRKGENIKEEDGSEMQFYYLDSKKLAASTQICWATGGRLVPDEIWEKYMDTVL